MIQPAIADIAARPHKRRRLLVLGIGAATLLAIGGGLALSVKPAWQGGKLTPHGRTVFGAVGMGVLDKSLPESGEARTRAIEGLLDRIDALVAALPPHAQDELGQLLSLLGTGAGRLGLAGLSQPWAQASAMQVQTALQGMRVSDLAMKQQAYHALHDIAAGAYFSDASTWAFMGYPGPTKIL